MSATAQPPFHPAPPNSVITFSSGMAPEATCVFDGSGPILLRACAAQDDEPVLPRTDDQASAATAWNRIVLAEFGRTENRIGLPGARPNKGFPPRIIAHLPCACFNFLHLDES